MSSTDTTVNPRLAALAQAGTAPWLDQISRGLIQTGELASMVKEFSLRGLTSNPAIFEKAILGAEEYDEQIAQLVAEGKDAREIYQAIAIKDVQDAADILRPVYDESNGTDGFVSFEVDPDLAQDAEKTIAQAREYWQRVDRPNLMIKIPGTPEGLGPIETAIAEGINVNVTLLFSVDAYADVAEAFIRGLEQREAENQSLDVQSVASFFVSRVDSEVDKRLEALDQKELSGKAGLANARAAYRKFLEIFHGERFAELKAAGAPVQRPLWASTGVKNPDYPDTMYVDGLVGPETVNTMPMATVKAAAERAEVDPSAEPTVGLDPEHDLLALGGAGIDMDDVTAKLLTDGIAAFVTPMESLLEGIEKKRKEAAEAGDADAAKNEADNG
ncbi:MAG: transaldolase [Solirubrobacterales bacterium]|nr:transaldolase [Solirubrobacterales bacterium]